MSKPVRSSRNGDLGVVVHRVRVPHGKGEINLVVHLVEGGEQAEIVDDEATSIHQLAQGRPPTASPQESANRDSSSRGFVLAPGGRVGKYELKEKLGQGTFGLVFIAKDTDLDRDVAIKLLNPSHQTNGDILHRFLQEARASARIAHPGIVTVLDCGKVATTIGDSAYIVLELLQGESLTNRLVRGGRLAAGTAVEITRQIASAIDAAHRADVLHRDLKPDNIYLVPDPAVPSGERVKVLDFGLAKLGASKHTMMNTVFGTPRYMSPEQCRSAALIDRRSDIYSLGCIMFELVTGRTPFDGDLRQLIEQHQNTPAPRAKSFAPELPPALDDLIAAMLAKDPNARPQTMAAVQGALYNHGAVTPGVAATMMPVAADMIQIAAQIAQTPRQQAQPQPYQQHDSGMMLVPPTPNFMPGMPGVPAMLPLEGTAPLSRKRRKAPIAAAAIAFFVAAALTAVAARGRTRSAIASPAPAIPTTPEPTAAPAPAPAPVAPEPASAAPGPAAPEPAPAAPEAAPQDPTPAPKTSRRAPGGRATRAKW